MAFNRPFQLKGLNDSVIFTVSIPSSPVEAEKCNKKRKMGEKKKKRSFRGFLFVFVTKPKYFYCHSEQIHHPSLEERSGKGS